MAVETPRAERTRYELLHLALTTLGHPVRLEILQMCGCGPQSPVAIADESAATLGTVAYHVRAMADDGLLKLSGERRVRGAVEHFYRLTARGRRLHEQLLGEEAGAR